MKEESPSENPVKIQGLNLGLFESVENIIKKSFF